MTRTTTLLALSATLLAASASADTLTLSASADTTLYSDNATFSNGAGDWIFSGDTGAFYKRRALIAFDVAGSIPAGSTITSVQLVMRLSNTKPGSQIVRLYRVTSPWGEGLANALFNEGAGILAENGDATWTQRYWNMGQPWTTAGGDYATPHSGQAIVGDALTDYSWPTSAGLVADAQGWLDAPATNHGWIVIGNEISSQTAKRFDSRTNPSATTRPRLVVAFTPPSCAAPVNYCVSAPNSVGPGAVISSTGSQSIAANQFFLTSSGAPPNVTGLFIFAPGQAQTPLYDGFLCVSGPLRRLPAQSMDSQGNAQRHLDFTLYPGSTVVAGQPCNFQLWYRDPAAGGTNANLSDGRSVVFCP